jgi:hypothetical protein
MREHLAHFSIAGFTYYDGVIAFNELKIGTKLSLVPDPTNQYDPRAIAIYYKEHKLGFIPKSDNRIFYKLLKVGFDKFEVRVQKLAQDENPEHQISVIVHLIDDEKAEEK